MWLTCLKQNHRIGSIEVIRTETFFFFFKQIKTQVFAQGPMVTGLEALGHDCGVFAVESSRCEGHG